MKPKTFKYAFAFMMSLLFADAVRADCHTSNTCTFHNQPPQECDTGAICIGYDTNLSCSTGAHCTVYGKGNCYADTGAQCIVNGTGTCSTDGVTGGTCTKPFSPLSPPPISPISQVSYAFDDQGQPICYVGKPTPFRKYMFNTWYVANASFTCPAGGFCYGTNATLDCSAAGARCDNWGPQKIKKSARTYAAKRHNITFKVKIENGKCTIIQR